MLFVVVQEPKRGLREAYRYGLQFVEAKSEADAVRQVKRLADPSFKPPHAYPVHAGLILCV